MNNFIKQQISYNNNNRFRTQSCIQYFCRKNMLISDQREKRFQKKWSEESKNDFSQTVRYIIDNKENNKKISPKKK